MSRLKIKPYTVMAIIIGLSGVVFCFSSSEVSASMPYDVITGVVLDDYGRPVPEATVTLMQDGQLWQPNESMFPGCTNPQLSRSINYKDGSFLFGVLDPGQYTISAEKYGYKSSASVEIYNTTIHSPYETNINLCGFDVSLSQEQVSYHGAIAGTLWDKQSERIVHYTDLYLRQNGQLVKITNNPQYARDGNYSFKHLAPGWYEIQVVVRDPSGNLPLGNWSINVGTDTVNGDLVLPYLGHSPPMSTSTPAHPSSTPSPTPTAASTQAATPAPSLSLVMILSSLGLAVLFNREFRKSG